MHILVLNGSPKGKYSVTLQTVLYLQKLHPEHTFEIMNVGQTVKSLEKDFGPARAALEKAELVLFSYPVYTFIAPSQLHRFVALMKGMDLRGKFASQITTSKHFYDVTAHRYIQDNCQDMGMKFVRGLSADMDDLLTDQGQEDAKAFFDQLIWCAEQDVYEPLPAPQPGFVPAAVTPLENSGEKTGDVVIITDVTPADAQLGAMIGRFRGACRQKTRVVNIREYPFRGGCLGCFNCAVTGKCVYTDGFDSFLREQLQTAQAMIYAFRIQDHSLGTVFKTFNDRQFCNGHRTVTEGMPVGYLVSGPYSREFNLQMILEGRAQVGKNFLAGIATDEENPDAQIDALASRLDYALAKKYVLPRNFYGVGGMKIFRDLIWLMQGMMRADHKFYKSHGHYDFPQKNRGTMLKMYLVGALLASPKVKAKMGNAMNEGMLMPYKKLLEKLDG